MNAELTQVRLQELRAEHQPYEDSYGLNWCSADNMLWPCEISKLIDMALEAERLRAALLKYGRHTSFCTWERVGGKECECGLLDVRSALAGTESKS